MSISSSDSSDNDNNWDNWLDKDEILNCLFCNTSFDSINLYKQHCIETHNFNFDKFQEKYSI